jgi:soluble lytic murein transglycosylase-like protein
MDNISKNRMRIVVSGEFLPLESSDDCPILALFCGAYKPSIARRTRVFPGRDMPRATHYIVGAWVILSTTVAAAEEAVIRPNSTGGSASRAEAAEVGEPVSLLQTLFGGPPSAAPEATAASAATAPVGSAGFARLIAKHAYDNGLPPALADAMVRIESRYRASARQGANMGLTQITLATARSLGYDGTPSGLLDADTNLRYGLKYLGMAYRLAGGDVCRTILKYQAGHRAVSMTGAARSYCARVRTIMVAR